MANFFKDNPDLQFYFDKWLDWDRIVRLTEVDFSLEGGPRSREEATELYRDILEMVGEYSAEEIAPKWDEIERSSLRLENGEVVFPPVLVGIFDQLSELGMHGLCVPRELGGMNVPLMVYMMNAEMFARADVGVMTHISFHCGIAMALLVYSVYEGSTEVDVDSRAFVSTRFQDAIEEIVAGKAWGSMDITEPDAGSDMAALRTRAVQDGDGNWRLTGQKIFITSGNGKYHIVIARTEDDAEGLEALSLFLVRLYEDGPDGERVWHGSISRLEEKLGHTSSPTAALEFEDAPAELIGERGDGFKLMLLLMNNARVGVAFEALGISECAVRMAREYAVQRPSMGKTIDRHEMIADYLEEMETDIQALRAITMHAAYYEELAQKTTIGLQYDLIADPADRAHAERELGSYKWESRRLTPLIKYFGAEKAVEIARRGIQIHGGVGYTKDYAAEKLLRDAMVLPIYEGTSQIQALMAMKDNLGRVLKDPQAFVREGAQLRWRSLSAKDPLERRSAAVRVFAHRALTHLITRTVAMKFKSIRHRRVTEWGKAFAHMDPKRDFSLAMLHAERLTKLLVDASVCELLWEQASRYPERRELLERWLVRAEPRSRYVFDELTSTGGSLLAWLAETEVEADAAE